MVSKRKTRIANELLTRSPPSTISTVFFKVQTLLLQNTVVCSDHELVAKFDLLQVSDRGSECILALRSCLSSG